MSKKVLSVSLRPKSLDQILGQENTIESVKNQFKSGRFPSFFLIVGATGSGKTTVARIIANMLQHKEPLLISQFNSTNKYDITEINASDKNGVDDIRKLIETIHYKPFKPSLSKVIIMDEAHQLTTAAQNALLKETEDTPNHSYFIFCTNNDSKIIPALKRRAYIMRMGGINNRDVHELLEKAKIEVNSNREIETLENTLLEHDINTPGLILQAAEKYFNGSSALESIYSVSSTSLDTKKICQSVSKGDWKSLSQIVEKMTKEDILMVRNCIMGYLKTIVIKSGSAKQAKALKIIAEETYEVPVFISNLAIACDLIKKE